VVKSEDGGETEKWKSEEGTRCESERRGTYSVYVRAFENSI